VQEPIPAASCGLRRLGSGPPPGHSATRVFDRSALSLNCTKPRTGVPPSDPSTAGAGKSADGPGQQGGGSKRHRVNKLQPALFRGPAAALMKEASRTAFPRL